MLLTVATSLDGGELAGVCGVVACREEREHPCSAAKGVEGALQHAGAPQGEVVGINGDVRLVGRQEADLEDLGLDVLSVEGSGGVDGRHGGELMFDVGRAEKLLWELVGHDEAGQCAGHGRRRLLAWREVVSCVRCFGDCAGFSP